MAEAAAAEAEVVAEATTTRHSAQASVVPTPIEASESVWE